MHVLARAELIACWILWAAAFLRVQRVPRKTDVIDKTANWGLLLQTLAYPFAWIFWRHVDCLAADTAGMLLAPVAAIAAWGAVRHLGRQWRIQAGLYADHELVRGGPYGIVRHPIYASMVALYTATALILSYWPLGIAGLALMIAGTEVRVRTEDRLLAARFGREFQEYRKSVKAYVPFVR